MMLQAEPEMVAAERAMFLDMMYDSATALLRLVEQVGTLSALRAGQWDFQFTRQDLCAVVRAAIAAATPDAVTRAVTIAQEMPVAATTMMDPPQLHQVIMTLLANAIRFSPREGLVGIQVTCVNRQVCLTVTDRGPGIALDALPQVFEAFACADIRHHSTGHGLSLAIARQIVLAHDGTLEVESRPGVATTFTVRLPGADTPVPS